MNKEYLKQLIDAVSSPNAEEKTYWCDNYDKRLAILCESLDETVEYIDTCGEKELDWISECFDELSEHFKSRKLIECVERNIARFPDPELQKQLKTELEYMKMHLA